MIAIKSFLVRILNMSTTLFFVYASAHILYVYIIIDFTKFVNRHDTKGL